jgi:2-dehydro-3-deoxyphosphogalactonate aldolase
MKPDNLGPYWAAGASGFGTGSHLNKPGMPAGVVREVAAAYAAAVRALARP